MRSNCLLAALIIRVRLGGEFVYRKPHRGNLWGHFLVKKGRYTLAWKSSLPAKDMHWWRQIWFPGRLERKG